MKSAKLIEQLNPLIRSVADLIRAVDKLADSGVGERTRDTLSAAGAALDAADRLMMLAFEDAADKENAP